MRFRTFRLFIGRMGEKMKSPRSPVQGLCLFLLFAACGSNEQDRGKLPPRREPAVVEEERKAQQAEEEAKKRAEAGEAAEAEPSEPEAEETLPAIQLTTQAVSIPSLGASLHGVVTSGD